MSNQQPYNGPRKKGHENALTEYKLRLMADTSERSILSKAGNPRRPELYFTFKDNQPNLNVRTNYKDDGDGRPITAGLDTITTFAILEAVDAAAVGQLKDINGKLMNEVRFPCRGYGFMGGKRSDAPIVKNEVIVGVNDNQEVYIAVTGYKRPTIPFVFRPSEWHGMSGPDGVPVSIATQARYYARGYAKIMRDLISNLAVVEFKNNDELEKSREERRQNARGNNRGGQNNNSGSGGYNKNSQYNGGSSYSQKSSPIQETPTYVDDGPSDFDDDLPW